VRTIVAVQERVQETPSTVTLRFPLAVAADPGQFVMVWIPGEDELPMSLSYTDGPSKGITVKAMGETTRNIQRIEAGTRLGIRGPYGNRFDPSPKRILIVAGGSGAAALAPGAKRAIDQGASITVALGATTGGELLFQDRFASMGAKVEVSTDDGSAGTRGYVTVVVERLIARGSFDAVWSCGPEVMMRKVALLAQERGVRSYGSVERQMKCALGMCDACVLGPFHVCVDGPVFPTERLLALPEFGAFKRDPAGRRVPH
jgi:dihydroorotate dehydrogenase electron transfer subunit